MQRVIRQSMYLRLLAAGLVLGLSSLASGAVEIVHVWPSYRTAESFQRVSEFFDGQENFGGETVRRTQPDARRGYYFLVRVRSSVAVANARFVVDVLRRGSPDPRTYTFAADLRAGEQVFELGLTGSDWPEPKLHPMAWRVVVRGPPDTDLAVARSFLWSLPPRS